MGRVRPTSGWPPPDWASAAWGGRKRTSSDCATGFCMASSDPRWLALYPAPRRADRLPLCARRKHPRLRGLRRQQAVHHHGKPERQRSLRPLPNGLPGPHTPENHRPCADSRAWRSHGHRIAADSRARHPHRALLCAPCRRLPDWNCSQHITPRYTREELQIAMSH